MTIYWKAEGASSVGGTGKDQALSIGTVLTEAHKSAVGKRLDVKLDAHALAFVLHVAAERFPEVFREIARILGDWEPPKHHGYHDFPRQRELQQTIEAGIRKYLEER